MKEISSYSKEFIRLVIDAHKGHESLPIYKEWIKGQLTSVNSTLEGFVQQIEYINGSSLHNMKILVFGCGLGGSSVAFALRGAEVYGVDISENCIKIARKRAQEHNVSDKIHLFYYENTKRLNFPDNMFDVVTCEAVLEHIANDRMTYIREMWRVLKKEGVLFIANTPNLLYPYDTHTTKLFFVPWMSAKLAKRYAIFRKRCLPSDDLELMGRRGTTYWFILGSLKGKSYKVVTSSQKCNLISYLITRKRLTNKKKKLFFPLLYMFNYLIAVPCGIPLGAFLSNLTFIGIRKK